MGALCGSKQSPSQNFTCLISLQTLEITFIDTKSFFLFEIWSWETDPGSVLLRVLGFLNLSEGPKTRDPQSDPQIRESQLTVSWLRFQSGFASLLALETFIQSVSETYFLQA